MRFFPLVILAGTSVLMAQRYEVASIKRSDPGAQGQSINSNAGGMLTTSNVTLKALITIAYDVRDYQIAGGPNWLSSDRYDIVARPENYAENVVRKPSDDERRGMVQSLLAERFKLGLHRETKEANIYSLIVARDGPKLKINTTGSGNQGTRGGRGQMTGYRLPMPNFAKSMSNQLSRTVVDNTGLKGEYDFELKWTPDLAQPDAAADSDGPSIFTAVQEQLGLKLVPAKGPVEVLVIDHAEKPADN